MHVCLNHTWIAWLHYYHKQKLHGYNTNTANQELMITLLPKPRIFCMTATLPHPIRTAWPHHNHTELHDFISAYITNEFLDYIQYHSTQELNDYNTNTANQNCMRILLPQPHRFWMATALAQPTRIAWPHHNHTETAWLQVDLDHTWISWLLHHHSTQKLHDFSTSTTNQDCMTTSQPHINRMTRSLLEAHVNWIFTSSTTDTQGLHDYITSSKTSVAYTK